MTGYLVKHRSNFNISYEGAKMNIPRNTEYVVKLFGGGCHALAQKLSLYFLWLDS
jgi:hypothetical protein